jgi:hypothetical protein
MSSSQAADAAGELDEAALATDAGSLVYSCLIWEMAFECLMTRRKGLQATAISAGQRISMNGTNVVRSLLASS